MYFPQILIYYCSFSESFEEEGLLKINIEIDELNERTSKQINLHFTPLSLGEEGEIRTIVTYINNQDYVRAINSDPAKISLDIWSRSLCGKLFSRKFNMGIK